MKITIGHISAVSNGRQAKSNPSGEEYVIFHHT